MQAFDSLTNQSGGNSTVAVATLTHTRNFDNLFAFGFGQLAKENVGVTFGDPAVFSVSGGNPDAGAFGLVMNSKSPLCVELANVSVVNGFGSEWVDHNEVFAVQDQLWSQPNQEGCTTDQNRDNDIDENVVAFGRIKNSLGQKQPVKKNCNTTPNEIATWPVGHLIAHYSIFAGESLDRKNNTK